MFRVFKYWRDHKVALIVSQVTLLIGSAAMIVMTSLTSELIDDGIIGEDIQVIVSVGTWMMILGVVAGLAMSVTAVLAVLFAQGTALRLREDAFDSVQAYSLQNHDKFRTGRLLVNLSSDVLNVANAFQFTVIVLLQAPFMIIIAVVLIVTTSPSMIWLLVVMIVTVVAILLVIVPRLLKAFVARQERLDTVNNTIQENLSGIRVAKAFAREDYELERFTNRSEDMRQVSFKMAFTIGLMSPLISGAAQLITVLAVSVGSNRVFSGDLAVGELTVFVQYLTMVVSPLAMLAVAVPFLLRGDNSARRIFEVIDEKPAITDTPAATARTGGTVEGRIELEGVSFAFKDADGDSGPTVLHDIDLTIEAGQRVGILGSTGAGKTALANLLTRFYDPTEGRVMLDGVDVKDYRLQELRSHVGVALQQALLLEGDVRFNLKFGNEDADDDLMVAAAKASDSYGFVMNIPEQWDAPVARRGSNFSGGQRQRLSMARAMTAEPAVLVLDDSTSALDAATEARVQAAIPDFAGAMTTIYIAQRISAVIDLDLIVLMDKGRVVGRGTHDELLESSDMYQEIFESQLGGDVLAGVEAETDEEVSK